MKDYAQRLTPIVGLTIAAMLSGCFHGAHLQIGVANWTDRPQDGTITVLDSDNETVASRDFRDVQPQAIVKVDNGRRLWLETGEYWIQVTSGNLSTRSQEQIGSSISCLNVDIHPATIQLGFCYDV